MKIYSPFHKLIIILSYCSLIIGQDTETAFVKYYKSDRDFIADVPMFATERRGQSHLEVTFNEKKHPVLKRWLNERHELIKEEMFVYNEEKALKKRLYLNRNRRTEKIIHYGEQEPWSVEFRKYSIPESDIVSYLGQQTEFILNGTDKISQINFRNINYIEYGTIHLSYNHLGFLTEEEWRTLPNEKSIRKFVYNFDIMNNVHQIWEFGQSGNEVSHVALSMAPEDKLYTTPPPRTGNELDEVDIIIKELKSKRVITSMPAIIPKTEWDRLKLTNNEVMDIVFVGIKNNRIRFSLPQSKEVLSMSLDRISLVTNTFGELIYPSVATP